MPANARRIDAEDAPEIVSPVVPLHRPKFVVCEGGGNRGKTTGIRVLMERALSAGRDVQLIDLDPRAQLGEFFEGVEVPPEQSEVVVFEFLEALVNAQAETLTGATPLSLMLDMNGNDPTFGRFAGSVELPVLLESLGVQPVRLRFLGPDPKDLDDLARDDAAGWFTPEATALILNAGTIRDGRSTGAAFEAVRAHPVFRAALARGAREVVLPRLDCMRAIEVMRLQFGAAKTYAPLGVVNRQRVTAWLRAVDETVAPMAGWLP